MTLITANQPHAQAAPPPFAVEEATIAQIHEAYRTGRVTCVQVVRAFLDRIEAYDKNGPAVNAIIAVNPRALERAAELDRDRVAGKPMGPLHGIPVILKDNYDTFDMPTTAGAVTLAKSTPPDDAFVVAKLRAAGAIVLAKANLTELARHGTTVSSLGGQTKNPYDLTRTAGGSSGGTGAAIAASFAVLGTGSDTGQSTRSPASATSLVGVRPTRGLVSRDGIVPVSTTQDEAGPIARTVEDAARMLTVMAGYDPADPITALGLGRVPESYAASLSKDALKTARIGVLSEFLGRETVHQDVNVVFDAAVAKLRALGATVIDVTIPGLADLTRDLSVMNFEIAHAFDRYLASLGAAAPVRTFEEFVARGEFHPSLKRDLDEDRRMAGRLDSVEYKDRLLRRDQLKLAVMNVLAANQLDAILYPHQRRLVATIGEEQLDRNGVLSNGTGLPAVTFPGGFSPPTASAPDGVPVGIELLGREWSEATLLRLAYAFQEHANVRKPPAGTPPLRR